MDILTVNVGGSSLRLGGHSVSTEGHGIEEKYEAIAKLTDMRVQLMAFLKENAFDPVLAVCHRIVHAGYQAATSKIIDAGVEQEIRDHISVAPIHNPTALNWIHVCKEVFGEHVPQVAVFDTGFYASLPDVAAQYAIPASIPVRRLGFHGLAHQSMILQAGKATGARHKNRRVLTLQLGSGCSITASVHGKPVDTSMGYSPLEGLMMSTRSGDIDPGILLYLVDEKKMAPGDLALLLSHDSGLLGVSERTANMAELLAVDDYKAHLAVDMFCYRIKKYIGTYAAVLGGLDLILIGGGIGEHLPEVRTKFLYGLEFLGVRLDAERNQSVVGTGGRISSDDSQVQVRVMRVEESQLMSDHAIELLSLQDQDNQ